MSERARRGGGTKVPADRRREKRPRPTPSWLMEQQELDEVARRRCLMILSVLSGERPVTDVVEEAKISRGTYYQLETKALRAMLAALMPGATAESSAAVDGAARRIADLEEKVRRLESEKRRSDRLLLLTKKLVKPGPMTTGAGRPPMPKKPRPSMRRGRRPSKRSSPTTAPAETAPPSAPSIPTPAGAAEP